jgi:hypothetical protein
MIEDRMDDWWMSSEVATVRRQNEVGRVKALEELNRYLGTERYEFWDFIITVTNGWPSNEKVDTAE